MSLFTKRFFVAAVLAVLGLAGFSQAAVIGRLDADYGYVWGDDTSFIFYNYSGAGFTNVNLSGVGYQQATGMTGSTALPDIAANDSYTFTFSDLSGVFVEDFDDFYEGNVAYTFTAMWNGRSVSETYSPHSNITGHFVPFVGNDENGHEIDWSFTDTVALIHAEVPLPSSVASGLVLLGVLGAVRRVCRPSLA